MNNYPWLLLKMGVLVILAMTASPKAGDEAAADPTPVTPAADKTSPVPEAPTNSAPVVNSAAPDANAKAPPALSWQTAEIMKLVQSGVEPTVVKTYVQESPFAAPPSVDEIIYLREHGVSADIVIAYILRGQQLQAQTQTTPVQPESPSTAGPAATDVPEEPQAQAPVYAEPATPAGPDYSANYPAYPDYAAGYGPMFVPTPPLYLGSVGYYPRFGVTRFGGFSHHRFPSGIHHRGPAGTGHPASSPSHSNHSGGTHR